MLMLIFNIVLLIPQGFW